MKRSTRASLSFAKYQCLSLRTAPMANKDHDLLHAVLGLVTEAGELADVIKKNHAYGKAIDRVNLMEEAGDVLWYISLISRALSTDMEALAFMNVQKLSKRYPEKFSVKSALKRNLKKERATLERLAT